MTISINWATKVINVPQADLTPLGGGVYQLNVDTFRLTLKNLEDDETGMPFLHTHNHNTQITVGGTTLARVVEIINGYTVTFEDGQYAVSLTGANNNLADVMNINQVSLRSNNTAGLVVTSTGTISPTQQQIRDALTLNRSQAPAAGSVDDKLDTLAVPPSAHLSVAYNDTADTLDIVAWLTRGNAIVTNPTAMSIVWRNPSGNTLFSLNQTNATLLATGHYVVNNWSQALVSDVSYQVEVSITDATGTVVTQRSVVTT